VAPTRGYNWAAEYRTSNGLTATDKPAQYFNKGTFDGSVYQSLASTTVLALRARFGYIQGGTSASGARLPPPQERLYAGGAFSVRGFQQNELGPQVYLLNPDAFDSVLVSRTDTSTTWEYISNGKRPERSVPSGGNALVVLNAEVRFRGGFLPDVLEVAPFVDAGQVWVTQVGKHINVNQLLVTPGLTFRYFWSFAPIQVNLGYNSYPPAQGTAYFAQPVNVQSNRAPLICVTAPDVTPVPFTRTNRGDVIQPGLASCPASYTPPPANSFFQRLGITRHLVFSLTIGTDF
jgi:outer membrane protein insertion porin family/translocation and assembly module TamA